jgi:hypothetical protein
MTGNRIVCSWWDEGKRVDVPAMTLVHAANIARSMHRRGTTYVTHQSAPWLYMSCYDETDRPIAVVADIRWNGVRGDGARWANHGWNVVVWRVEDCLTSVERHDVDQFHIMSTVRELHAELDATCQHVWEETSCDHQHHMLQERCGVPGCGATRSVDTSG